MATKLTYRHTLNSNDAGRPQDGAVLHNVEPLDEEYYDRGETGPMFTAEAEGFDGILHLFSDEIDGLSAVQAR